MKEQPSTPQANQTDYFASPINPDDPHGSDTREFISMDYMPAFQTFPVMSEEQLIYLLLTLRTGADRRSKVRTPLNICLVIDQSSSMRGEKLFAVKTAARNLVDKLASTDYFSLVSFNDRATVVVSCQPVSSREAIKQQIDSIEGRGGTELASGLFAGINEMRSTTTITPFNYILLLTDGQTYGDMERCIHLGEEAARHKIIIHPMGIGVDWNEDLLETIASKSAGTSEYIQTSEQIVSTFMHKMNSLRGIISQNCSLRFEAVAGIKLKRVYKLSPVIAEAGFINTGPGIIETNLGPVAKESDYSFLIEIIAQAARGTHEIGKLSVSFAPAGVIGATKQVEMTLGLTFVDLETQVTIEPDVKDVIEKVTAFNLQNKAWQDLAAGDIIAGTKRLAAVNTRLLSMGKGELARQVQQEILNLKSHGAASKEGTKQIKFGTRELTTTHNQLMD